MTFVIHQSDLQQWSRCAEAWRIERTGVQRRQLSATAFGSVMHHAIHVGTRFNDVQKALDTFEYYWNPLHIDAITEPVTDWLPRETYSSLRVRGRNAIRRFFEQIHDDDGELLGLEYEFIVPVEGAVDPKDGTTVLLAGTADRMVARSYHRFPTLDFEDLKTGKRKTYLRHEIQGTAYAYASTRPEFWTGSPEHHTEGFGDEGKALYLRFAAAARRFRWIDLKDGDWVDGGFRGPKDYTRFAYAVQQVVNAVRADIYPLTLVGAVCQFCDFRDYCAGVGISDTEGNPREQRR